VPRVPRVPGVPRVPRVPRVPGVAGVPGVLATAGVRLDDECEDPIELAFEAVDAGN